MSHAFKDRHAFKDHLSQQLQGVTAHASANGELVFKNRAVEALQAAGMIEAARLVLRLPTTAAPKVAP